MDDLLERIADLSEAAKWAVLAVAIIIVSIAYYSVFYADLISDRAQVKARTAVLLNEKSEYDARRKQYLAFQNEVNSLLEQQKELLRVLPRKDDIEQFIENVNSQVELAGLSHVSSLREAPIAEELYLRMPIQMSAKGTYHQFNRFFKNIGELQRIVTISDLQLKRAVETGKEKEPSGGELLQAEFVATTFQLQDRSAPVAAPASPGSSPGSTPGSKR